ncbi:MAG TPA: hypothetical protein VGC55_06135 [Dokdonella sp.]
MATLIFGGGRTVRWSRLRCRAMSLPGRWRFFAAAAALALTMTACSSGTSRPLPRAAHEEGIWKAAVPSRIMQGEFGNLDPMGLIADAQIPCDCSINWSSPDTGKRYCFVSATSLVYFLRAPHHHIDQAAHAWAAVRR